MKRQEGGGEREGVIHGSTVSKAAGRILFSRGTVVLLYRWSISTDKGIKQGPGTTEQRKVNGDLIGWLHRLGLENGN